MVRRALLCLVCALMAACGGLEGSMKEPSEEKPSGLRSIRQRLVLFDYTASDTDQASNPNTSVDYSIFLKAGEAVTIGTCGLSGTSRLGPDTVLRFFDPDGQELSGPNGYSNSCEAEGAKFSYTPSISGTFLIRAGCLLNLSCSGTVAISRRRGAPIPFSAKNTNNASINTYNKQYYFAGGEVVRASTCSYTATGATASGDTHLRLYKNNGGVFTQVAENASEQQFPGQCMTAAEIVYTVPSAGYYQVRVGCAANTACSGHLAVYAE